MFLCQVHAEYKYSEMDRVFIRESPRCVWKHLTLSDLSHGWTNRSFLIGFLIDNLGPHYILLKVFLYLFYNTLCKRNIMTEKFQIYS